MPLRFYKPDPQNQGIASFWSFHSKDNIATITLKRQTGYDKETEKGAFEGGETVKAKLNLIEIAKIIVILESEEFHLTRFIHVYDELSTQIQFKKIETITTADKPCLNFIYILEIQRFHINRIFKFQTSYTPAEGLLLREYLKFVLTHIFSAIYSADKKLTEAYKKEQERLGKTLQSQAPLEPAENHEDDETK